MNIKNNMAIAELKDIFRLKSLWMFWGWLDIRQRYRRSLLGPFWVTMTMAVSIVATGLVYAYLFKQDISVYLPYVASGFVIWSFISGFISEAGTVIYLNEGYIHQLNLPLLIYPTRLLWRYLVMFLHHMIILIVVLFLFSPFTLTSFLAAMAGLLLTSINLYWMGILLALLSVRLRDLPILVSTIFQVMFLITPVIWPAKALGDRLWLVMWNPFYHLLEAVRAPLLDGVQSAWFFHMSILTYMAIIGSCVAFSLLSAWKRWVVYWL